MPILESVLSFNGGSVVHVPMPRGEVLSLAARFRQQYMIANNNLQRASSPLAVTTSGHTSHTAPTTGSFMTMASNLIKSSPRMSESLDDDDEDESNSLKLQTLGVTEDLGPSDSRPEPVRDPSPLPERPPVVPTGPVPPAVSVASYFGGFGKKISAFGASSLETVRSNIAAAQLAHQQQQELLKQQQAMNPPPENAKPVGAVLWSTPDLTSGVSSSSGATGAAGATAATAATAAKAGLDGGIAWVGGLRSVIASKMNRAPVDDKVQVNLPGIGSSNTSLTFVIDEEEDEDDGMGPRDIDPQKIGVSKTDTERAQVDKLDYCTD